MKTICRIILPFHIVPLWTYINMHYRQRMRMRDDCIKLLKVCGCHEEKYAVKGKTKRSVEIISHRLRLIRDDVNLRGGAKPLVDAMVGIRLLYDDSDKYLDENYSQVRTAKDEESFTEIIIMEGE